MTIVRGEGVSCFSFDLPVEQYLDFCTRKKKKKSRFILDENLIFSESKIIHQEDSISTKDI